MPITINNLQKKVPIPAAKILKAVDAAQRKLKLKLGGLSIVFVGRRRMRAINNKYLQHDYVTDVLTFDLGQEGEIIICPHVACANAKIHQTSTDKELLLYVIHGLLHLAGYDDHREKDKIQMRRMEKNLLEVIPLP